MTKKTSQSRGAAVAKSYWLMKSEPDVYSIADLKRDRHTLWEGVRNYQARNFMMNEMKPGDAVVFYHSNAEPPGAAGLAEVSRLAVPDPAQFNPDSEYHDPKAAPERPIWYCVEVSFVSAFKEVVPLAELRCKKELGKMLLLQKGQRLSVMPLTENEYRTVAAMGGT